MKSPKSSWCHISREDDQVRNRLVSSDEHQFKTNKQHQIKLRLILKHTLPVGQKLTQHTHNWLISRINAGRGLISTELISCGHCGGKTKQILDRLKPARRQDEYANLKKKKAVFTLRFLFLNKIVIVTARPPRLFPLRLLPHSCFFMVLHRGKIIKKTTSGMCDQSETCRG